MSAHVRTAALASGRVEYRYERRGPATVLVCHGGHLSAGIPVGEEVFAEAGMSVLAPSRPGYGATTVSCGPAPEQFAHVVRDLWRSLGIERIDAVVGFSAGGPLAVAIAAQHPTEVGSLILQSARSSLPWPDPLTTSLAGAVLEPWWEQAVWATARSWMALAPDLWLLAMLRTMSLRPAPEVLADLSIAERHAVRQLFSRMRSGHGFTLDLRLVPDPALELEVTQPTLVMASPNDSVLPFAHTEHLGRAIPGAEVFSSPSLSHLIWFGSGAEPTRARIAEFLART